MDMKYDDPSLSNSDMFELHERDKEQKHSAYTHKLAMLRDMVEHGDHFPEDN